MNKLDDDLDVEIGRRRPTAMDPHVLLSPAERRRLARRGDVALPTDVVPAPVPVAA